MAILRIETVDLVGVPVSLPITITLVNGEGTAIEGFVGGQLLTGYVGKTNSSGILEVDLPPNGSITTPSGTSYLVEIASLQFHIIKSTSSQTLPDALAASAGLIPSLVSFAGGGLPLGGVAGQVPVKQSSTDFDISWGSGAAAPTGAIVDFAGVNAPAGWVMCNGQTLSRTGYAALFTVIGATYGNGDGVTTFNVPDLRGRTRFGRDTMGASNAGRLSSAGIADALGVEGGEAKVTLSSTEMPSHTHNQDPHGHTQGAHNHTTANHSHGGTGSAAWVAAGGDWLVLGTYGLNNSSWGVAQSNVTVDNATPTINNSTAVNQTAGGGAAHNNMPPFLLVNSIIKA